MAEETVVKEPLTPEMIASGADLTKRLDSMNLTVVCSFWYYYVDLGQWRLVFASPRVDTDGPSELYSRIQTALTQKPSLPGLTLHDIKLLSPGHPLAISLRGAIKSEPKFISGIRFTRNRINDIFVEDAYLYRAA